MFSSLNKMDFLISETSWQKIAQQIINKKIDTTVV